MKIGIVGLGFVGGAIKATVERYVQLVLVDSDSSRATHSLGDLHSCDAVYICVPTPTTESGVCDVTHLESVLESLRTYDGVIISKCTATPDVYSRLQSQYPNLVHSPEFLTANNAVVDYSMTQHIIVGGFPVYTHLAERILRVGLQHVKSVVHCTIQEASLTKYAVNAYLATKVVYMNELYDLATSAGIDYTKVKELCALDSRVGSSHMSVPGSDGYRGYGGGCFPKDTSALLSYAQCVGVDLSVIRCSVDKNKQLRKL